MRKILGLKLTYCLDYFAEFNQIILNSDKDQQILFMGDQNTDITNPTWQMAAILKNIENRHKSATS